MTKFIVTNHPAQFGPGTPIRPSKDQLRRRRLFLREVKKGVYEPTSLVVFKLGEVLNLPKGCPKGLADCLVPQAEVAKAAAKAKADDDQQAAAAREAAKAKRHAELIEAYEGDDAAKAKFDTADAYADAVIAEEFPA